MCCAIKNIRLAYIGGGSRGWAWSFMTDLAMEPAMGGEVLLYDIDRPAAEANAIIGNRLDARLETPGHWHYQVAEHLEDALEGADFVIISILPGTFDDMAVDVHLPERLGIWQSVGDTVGPGGINRALRTLPMYVPIGEAIRKCCPGAWVINYTNPMALCLRMLYHVFPEIKALGCCHEVFSTQKLLGYAVAETYGITPPDRRDIHVNVLGLNHFTWFTEASYQGIDLFPVYRDFAERHADGFDAPDTNWVNSSFHCAHRVKFDLFRRYGAIAAAGDRHLAEFVPQYLKAPETVRQWKFGLTSVQWRKDDLAERLRRSKALVAGEEALNTMPSGEEGVLLLKALCGLGRVISNVNLPNRGQISNLPMGTVVETNAVFARDSVRPVLAGAAPEALGELMAPHVENQELVLRAVLTGDVRLVVQALANDPNTASKCRDLTVLGRLAKDMMEKTGVHYFSF